MARQTSEIKRGPHMLRAPVETVPGTARAESRALAKGLQMLEEIALLSNPASLGQLAGRVGLGKASTFRLLQTLVATGYLVQQPDQTYVLNRPWTPALTHDWLRKLIADALPEMKALSAEVSETITLAVLMQDHIRVVETIESPHHIRMSNYRDRILPPYASSLGKAIAAYQPAERLQTLLNVYGIYATTEKTIVDPALIRQEMAKTRMRGYSSEYEETVRGGCCFGAPIFTDGGVVPAAMSVSLPAVRLTAALEEVIPQMLCAAAQRVSETLGGRPESRKHEERSCVQPN